MPTRLSVDVLQLVLDEIFVWKDEPLWHLNGMRGRRSWLASTLTVSYEWYIASLPRLYWLIEISPGDETTLDLLLRTLRHRPALGRLIRVVRPYERAYQNRDPYALSDIFMINQLNIPFITKKGRRHWAVRRRVRKFGVLLGFCADLDELVLDSGDVTSFAPVIKQAAGRLCRLVLEGSHRIDMAKLTQVADWSELRSLRLDASRRYEDGRGSFHNSIPRMDVAAFVSMTRLVELEVVGRVTAHTLHDILHILRGTLRSLTCNNIYGGPGPEFWLSPVCRSLWKLQLYDHSDGRLCNLAFLTALKKLHVLVNYPGHLKSSNIQPPSFPRGINSVEWSFLCRDITPARAEERVRDVFDSYDDGAIPDLRSVVVRVAIHTVGGEEKWSSVSKWLELEGARRSLNCFLEFEQDCTQFQPEDPRDFYALSAHAKKLERERVSEVQELGRPSVEKSGVARIKALPADAWALCCCIQ